MRRVLFLIGTILLPLAAASLTAQERPTHEVGVHFRLLAVSDTPGVGGVNGTGAVFGSAGGRRLRWFSDVSFVSGTHAKVLADRFRSIPVKQGPAEGQPAVLVPVIGGIVGGAAGLVVGALYGAAAGGGRGGGFAAAAGGFLIGVLLGEPLGLACGVHLGNDHGGSVPIDVVVSVLTAAAGVGVAVAAKEARVLIAIPIAQLVATVATERTTAAKGNHKDVGWCPGWLAG